MDESANPDAPIKVYENTYIMKPTDMQRFKRRDQQWKT